MHFNGETEKKNTLSLLWKISLPSGGIQERKPCQGSQDEIKEIRSTTKQALSGETLSKQFNEPLLELFLGVDRIQ